MKSIVKKIIKSGFRLLGRDIVRYNPSRHILLDLFDHYQVDAIFDIGANIGMSAKFFRTIGFTKTIVSFEPVSHFYQELKANSLNDQYWFIENVALGESIYEADINVSDGSGGASSILEMTDIVKVFAPDQAVVKREKVRVVTLDSIINRYYPEGDRLFLKIDVQGYEKKVLAGAQNSIDRVIGLKIEMSLNHHYEGDILICEMLPFLNDLGFRLVFIEEGWFNQMTREIYQVDGTFFRTDRLS
jgi:FkbM family methyltransferase